jgi:hypothetical protein
MAANYIKMAANQVLSYAGEMSFHPQERSSFMRKGMILQQQQGGFVRRTRQRSQGGSLPHYTKSVLLQASFVCIDVGIKLLFTVKRHLRTEMRRNCRKPRFSVLKSTRQIMCDGRG